MRVPGKCLQCMNVEGTCTDRGEICDGRYKRNDGLPTKYAWHFFAMMISVPDPSYVEMELFFRHLN